MEEAVVGDPKILLSPVELVAPNAEPKVEAVDVIPEPNAGLPPNVEEAAAGLPKAGAPPKTAEVGLPNAADKIIRNNLGTIHPLITLITLGKRLTCL